jgi:hypothetical protein
VSMGSPLAAPDLAQIDPHAAEGIRVLVTEEWLSELLDQLMFDGG